MASVRPAWQSNTAVVRASAVFRTKLRHLLTYKGMQPAKNDAIWCKKYSHGPFGLCATAVKEEEDDDETLEKLRALSTCRRTFVGK